jgi:hypothetical protein
LKSKESEIEGEPIFGILHILWMKLSLPLKAKPYLLGGTLGIVSK